MMDASRQPIYENGKVQLPYICRFCQAIRYSPAIPEKLLGYGKQFIELVVCDPCAKFQRNNLDLQFKIVRSCTYLHQQRMLAKPTLKDMEAFVRDRLTERTQSYSALLCYHHGIQDVWEPEFVDLLMDHPDKAAKILSDLLTRVKTESRKVKGNETAQRALLLENHGDRVTTR